MIKRFACLLVAVLLPAPAVAEVHDSSSSGFVIRHAIDVPASQRTAWSALIAPARWWNAEHSYSQDAANLSLDARAGGCFCEVLPNPVSPKAAPRGSVEHMRVVYVEEPRALRMSGALGPLQSGAGTGTLTVILKTQGEGTRILWEYVYGGYVRGNVSEIAASVDAVLAGQLLGLGKVLGAGSGARVPTSESAPVGGRDDPARIDFVREMEAGIAQSAKGVEAGQSGAPERNPAVPDKPVNDQGFIGR
jgi:hypothetical protein